ncbi:acyl-CoA synthetase [Subtercola sp. YIM 133946]|uniref:acyl-CoA synthetase n=1 Tax=Subtercola sp. YIM 133946 TaxID=3118909 RepID=UPI002F93BB6A
MANQGIGTWAHRRRVKSAGMPAIIHNDREVDYDELATRVDRLAGALADRGVARGDRVAYLGNNHPAFIETMFACGLLGAVFVPLNTRLVAAELAHMIDDSGAETFVYSENLSSVALDALAGSAGGVRRLAIVGEGQPRATAARGSSPTTDARGSSPAATDARGTALAADDARGTVPVAEPFEQLLASGDDRHRDEPVGLDDPAVIIYTSGTTGRPKGAVLTHGNLTWNALNVLTDYDVLSDERSLMIAPLFHVASLGMGCLPTLLKGGTVIVAERFEPGQALALIEKHRATFISGVPTTFQLLCEHPHWASTDISSLRSLTCGGSAVPARVREAYERRGLSFSSGYGMTETAPGVTSLQPRYSVSKAGSAGLPHFFTEVRVAGPTDVELPHGMVGEIQALGPNAISEYWNDPVATAALRTADGWLKTGDLGYVDDEGFLFISDRIKDMIISGGENIYSAEVEEALMRLPWFTGVAVIGRPDERWGEVPHAVVVLAPGVQHDPAQTIAELRSMLAKYKIPQTYEVVAELPRTASGKVRKNALRQAAANA